MAKSFTIHDFKNVAWHNGAGRTVTATSAGTTSFTISGPSGSGDCTGLTAATFINRLVTGGTVGARVFATSIVNGPGSSCTVNLNKATTITNGTVYTFENSSSRGVTDAVLSGTSITSVTANFTAADVGLDVSGTLIPLGDTLAAPCSGTSCTLATTADGPGSAQTISFGGAYQSTDNRQVNDATGTATTVTSTAAKFDTGANKNDVGLKVSGTGIIGTCIITSNTGTVATVAGPSCNPAATNGVVVIGEPSATAPQTGESVMDQGVQLDLNPTLIAGTRPCADNAVEGFHIEGTWSNPGDFITGAFATQPAGTKAIGQITVKTAAGINYAAFVIETPKTGDAVIGSLHYNIDFVNVPTTIAECPATAGSPGLGYSLGLVASTPSVALLPSGTGRPGTAQLRATTDDAEAGATVTAFLTSEDPSVTLTGPAFQRLCVTPAGAPTVGFQCGTG